MKNIRTDTLPRSSGRKLPACWAAEFLAPNHGATCRDLWQSVKPGSRAQQMTCLASRITAVTHIAAIIVNGLDVTMESLGPSPNRVECVVAAGTFAQSCSGQKQTRMLCKIGSGLHHIASLCHQFCRYHLPRHGNFGVLCHQKAVIAVIAAYTSCGQHTVGKWPRTIFEPFVDWVYWVYWVCSSGEFACLGFLEQGISQFTKSHKTTEVKSCFENDSEHTINCERQESTKQYRCILLQVARWLSTHCSRLDNTPPGHSCWKQRVQHLKKQHFLQRVPENAFITPPIYDNLSLFN